MKITLITVGKIKEKYLKDAIAEYSKRLSRYCKLEIIEVADEKTPDNASETVEDGIRDKEGERILKYVKDDAYVVTLEIKGKLLTSEELAALFLSVQPKAGSQSHYIYHRRLDRTWKRSAETLGLCTKFFKNDISTSADAGDPPGTDLQKLPDHQP